MNENSDLLPNLLHEEFEMQMRGYSRRQVDDFVARRNNEIRELEQRLARTLDESEHLHRELSTVRQQALSGRPAHEEVSERIAQILKLADDEAKAQKSKADDDIANQRAEAQQESDRVRADAREQAERMLTAAQEQAERTISAARNEADKTRTAARTEADRLTSDTRKKADQALAQAKAQAKKVLDEATARATAIHDGAERRLNLLSTRHTETVRRLTDILDGVQGLVAAEAARMSLEEEVNQSVSRAVSLAEAAEAAAAAEPEDDGPAGEGGRDLALLAPPAPETVSTGTVAPPRGEDMRPMMPGRPGLTGRLSPPVPDLDRDAFDGTGPGGGLLPPPDAPRGPFGRPGSTPPPPMGSGPGRHSSLQDGMSRPPAPLPGNSAPLIPGLGDPLGDRDTRPGSGLIDPDEPTEGIRLLQLSSGGRPRTPDVRSRGPDRKNRDRTRPAPAHEEQPEILVTEAKHSPARYVHAGLIAKITTPSGPRERTQSGRDLRHRDQARDTSYGALIAKAAVVSGPHPRTIALSRLPCIGSCPAIAPPLEPRA
jgi:chemotaxis protein histidine kinase CheA